MTLPFEILYEDNHLIAVNKRPSDLVQADETQDAIMPDYIKKYLKEKYNKPGDAFLGVIHRLDRPASGVVLFAKTSKGLSRMVEQFKNRETQKTYWIVVEGVHPNASGSAEDYLIKQQKQNKSYVTQAQRTGAKKATLHYTALKTLDNYTLFEVQLETGRHHQIRVQMSSRGYIIKGDIKYGAHRANTDKSIHLHARSLAFHHPVSKEWISLVAPLPTHDGIWRACEH
ncbi:MAG: RluA family pseudouridine synthase [Schleiferiaceae bacterium]|nr:RluA family pseudouridine synthase [Schleiferiaceae bacterium]